MKRTVAALMLVLAPMTGAVLGRQTPAPARQDPPPTFRVAVNFVQIDAVVTDAEGRFVRGLTKDDFELIEGETPQTISAFTLVDVPVVKSEPRPGGEAPIEPDVRTNLAPLDGRLFVIVLDDLQTSFDETVRVRWLAKDFVRRFVGANDLVAVVHTGTGGQNAQDFTSSPARLSAAIDKFAGAKDLAPPNDPLFNPRNALRALRSVSELLGRLQDRRKAVVWFSAGVTPMGDDGTILPGATGFGRDVNDTIDAARRAGVAFYAVDPRGLPTGVPLASAALGSESVSSLAKVMREHLFLRRMSEETGGFAIALTNAPEELFPRLIEENSRYYLLGYYPTNSDRDGTFRPVQVRVKRRGLHVRARAGYTAPAAAAASDGAAPPLEQALYSVLPVSGLGLRVFAAPFAGASRNAAIAVAVELTSDRLNFVEKASVHSEQIELAFLAVDAAGKPHPVSRKVAAIRVPSANLQAMKQQGVRLARRVDLPPGRYQLRVAARAANSGAVGAVTYDLDVPDFSKRAFTMSGIALMSVVTSGMPTSPPAPDLLDVVPDVPTATRAFSSRDTLGVFAEIYDRRASPPRRVTVTTTITDDAGTVVTSSAVERTSGQVARAKGRLPYATSVPLAKLARGRYLLRVEARSSGAGARVARETEFWVQ